MNTLRLLTFGLVSGILFVSCEAENLENAPETQEQITSENPNQEDLEITDEVVGILKDNYFNVNDVQVVDFYLPDGTTEKRYQIEDDITFTAEHVQWLKQLGKSTRNYHTNNLVSPGTLTIIGYTGGGGFGLSSKERTALQWAVNNYNRLNLTITMSLTFGTAFQDKDMVVYHNPNQTGSGGSAGFPSNGIPNKFIQIYGLDNFSTNVNEHVITHEIGHSVGFRHTDWFSRQSCGENINEGVGSIGANPIPGTPSGYDPTSLMLACFSASDDGEFNNNDITALRFLY